MPFIDPSPQVLPRVPSGQLPSPAPAASTLWDTLAAAGRQENIVPNVFDALTNHSHFDYDPAHNPLDVIRGTKYETDYVDRFTASRNDAETHSIMRKVDNYHLDVAPTMGSILRRCYPADIRVSRRESERGHPPAQTNL